MTEQSLMSGGILAFYHLGSFLSDKPRPINVTRTLRPLKKKKPKHGFSISTFVKWPYEAEGEEVSRDWNMNPTWPINTPPPSIQMSTHAHTCAREMARMSPLFKASMVRLIPHLVVKARKWLILVNVMIIWGLDWSSQTGRTTVASPVSLLWQEKLMREWEKKKVHMLEKLCD